MSADNGIYVGVFSDGEVRAIHAQAIDNLWYPDGENAESVVDYFGSAQVFANLEKAYEFAHGKEREIYDSDFPVLEYGVSTLEFEHPFSFYEKESKKTKRV